MLLLNAMGNNQAGLYIHFPFCLSKCGYCSFYSISAIHLIPEFVKTVSQEMAFYKKSFQSFDTIYIGGGTPSLLSIQQMDDILKSANDIFNIDRQAELTVEVNPGDVSLEYFQQLRKRGINRLNIGIQSFNDSVLKFLGRRHSAEESIAAVAGARQAGFDNIGIDLMYDVYGQDIKTWKETLNKALSFFPEHLSCYQLSLDEKTPLYKRYRKESLQLPAENEALDFFMNTSKTLTDKGYIHYEVSNFARADSFKSRHNMKYWRHLPYLGLGPAAHSFLDSRRWWNKADIKTYLNDICEGKKPVDKSETLSIEQLVLESLFLGMRTKDGIHLQNYKNRFGTDILVDKKQVIDELVKNKLVALKEDCLCPTLTGLAVADNLAHI